MGQKEGFGELFRKARALGVEAGMNVRPVPMNVVGRDANGNEKRWHVSEGMCGFAWVKVRPGNCAFANWLKKQGLGSKAYGGGVQIWISDFNQSVDRKSAMADVMAKVFQQAGIEAIAGSRLD